MQYMASGFGWAERRMKFDYHALIGWGVIVAGLTGAGAWLAGRPFLTSDYGYVKLPFLEEFELAPAMGCDLGVFLTVVGPGMVALPNLSLLAPRPAHPVGPQRRALTTPPTGARRGAAGEGR